jgi:hypothetical protein
VDDVFNPLLGDYASYRCRRLFSMIFFKVVISISVIKKVEFSNFLKKKSYNERGKQIQFLYKEINSGVFVCHLNIRIYKYKKLPNT